MKFSRRQLLKLAGLSPLTQIVGIQIAQAEDRDFKHAITLFDDIKYPPDFKHFDYVNPDAPKGGRLRLAALGSFDSMNPFTFKGDPGGAITNEPLFEDSLDEPTTRYGIVAEGAWYPEDRSMVVFRLRPEARFHDNTPMTPEDVIWSMDALKDAHPQYSAYYKNVRKGEQTGDHEVTFTFTEKGNRELPGIVSQLFVLPKAWWTGKDASGKQRDIRESAMEVPLGSGPYKITDVKSGSAVTLSRVSDHWGQSLPSNVGANNFEAIEYIYFNDMNVAIEAFKSGQVDFRSEYIAKNWATGYDFPAVKDGRVIKEEIATEKVEGMQAWTFNLRRPKFQDVRLRRAFNYAFDFEWARENLFYGQYQRSRSYFNKSAMEAKGLPSPEELAILEPLRAQLPAEVFSAEYANPVNDTPQNRRKNLHEAAKLLEDAGWKVSQEGARSVLKNDKGEKLTVEILLESPVYERITLPYKQQLELLGITVDVKTVDTSQYERRMETFDFDVTINRWDQSLSPGNEQRDFFGSAAADKNGSRNRGGIKNPAVDSLIETLIFAKTRADLVTACKALDRALMWNDYVVPMYFTGYDRIAYWNKFSRPEKLPAFSIGFPGIWWWDAEKAKKTGGA